VHINFRRRGITQKKAHTIRVYFGTPEGKRKLGRPGLNGRNVKMNRKCRGWEGVVVIGLTQDRDFVNTVMILRVP
jgi:hypothetical protein